MPALCNDYSKIAEGPAELGNVSLTPGSIVFDCGANLGLFSLMAAAKGCDVYAFEPVPSVARLAEKATEIFPGIKVVNYALSDKRGIIDMNLSESTNTANSIVFNAGSETVKVESVTIDEFMRDHDLERIDFIKADIEGAERLMLRGAREALRRFSPKLSICTYHFPDDKEVLESLILEANPEYVIEHKWQKLYAYVP